MEDILDHFQEASGDPKALVCTTCHSKLFMKDFEIPGLRPEFPKSVLRKHLKTRKHKKALSKLHHENSISDVKNPKSSALEKTEIFQPQMENVILRFPHLAEKYSTP